MISFLIFYISILSFSHLACASDEFSRQLSSEMNPGCVDQLDNSTCSAHRLLSVTATGADALHVLVSLWGAPSVLLLRTARDHKVSIDWKQLVSDQPDGAVTVTGPVAAQYGVYLDQLIEFDDPADSADLFASDHVQLTSFEQLLLSRSDVHVSVNGSSLLQLSVKSPALNESALGEDGTVTFKFEILNSERRSDELPHLEQTGNSAIIGVVFDKLVTHSNFNHSRFGVQLATVGTLEEQLLVTKSLDDEYTPGVFKLVSLMAADTLQTGFLQWRPVTYTSADFSIEHSTTARHYNVTYEQSATPRSALLRAYFGPDVPVNMAPVTFGLAEDGWYKDSMYASWSTTVGTGAPPQDRLSLMVILLLAVGLGVPGAALCAGSVWIVVRKLRAPADASRLIADVEEE